MAYERFIPKQKRKASPAPAARSVEIQATIEVDGVAITAGMAPEVAAVAELPAVTLDQYLRNRARAGGLWC